jgi:prenyl protein peptidase
MMIGFQTLLTISTCTPTTRHLLGPIVSHVFCNVMGLPDVGGAMEHDRRWTIGAAYVLGVALFAAGLGGAVQAETG